MKLKKGDKVVVIAGSNKGKEGTITKVLDEKVIIEGVNLRKKHLKPKNNNGNGDCLIFFKISLNYLALRFSCSFLAVSKSN